MSKSFTQIICIFLIENNQELEAKISKVCERMTVINKRLEDGEDEMINFLKQNNARSNNCI